jgi:hypothetical protein
MLYSSHFRMLISQSSKNARLWWWDEQNLTTSICVRSPQEKKSRKRTIPLHDAGFAKGRLNLDSYIFTVEQSILEGIIDSLNAHKD